MPRLPDESLTKITLNLYTKDVEYYKEKYPSYTEAIRKAVRKMVRYEQQAKEMMEQYHE